MWRLYYGKEICLSQLTVCCNEDRTERVRSACYKKHYCSSYRRGLHRLFNSGIRLSPRQAVNGAHMNSFGMHAIVQYQALPPERSDNIQIHVTQLLQVLSVHALLAAIL